ncbi:MAG: hypothetical protein LKI85_03335 [Enterobacter sp.]|nr:hypothetical protein [Enterobacter sp.]
MSALWLKIPWLGFGVWWPVLIPGLLLVFTARRRHGEPLPHHLADKRAHQSAHSPQH